MRLQSGTDKINERSVLDISITWLDNDRVLTVPASARYRIDDVSFGNSRARQILDWTAISSIATTNTITVTSEQNRILYDSSDTEKRVVTVEATRSADSQKVREAFVYELRNLPGAA